jgi:hypothetical protein
MARKNETFGPWETITLTRVGHTYEGQFRIEGDDWICVMYQGGASKRAQLRKSNAQSLATLLLGELVAESRR